jgi:pyruvate kinase
MRKTKIVCTIGPVSESEDMICQLVTEGMNVARLNFSHGDHAEHKRRIDAIKRVRDKLQIPVAIMLDTKGPEVRLGYFKDGKADLEKGQKFTLTTRDIQGDSTQCSITYKELPNEVSFDSRILIADGVIELKVLDKNDTDVICQVVNGGTLGDRKNVNIPGATSKLPAITAKDISDLVFGVENDVDFVAASFIRKAADVLEIRKILEENGGKHIQIIAKIENQEGVDNLRDILRVCDGLMVARGDLGVEIPTEEIPMIQKLLIRSANEVGKPVITATQMLDSMIRNPRPTRAEVTDVANSIIDGTDAIMLSGETAAGKYPVEAVRTMSSIAERTERELDYGKSLQGFSGRKITVASAISHSSCTTAFELQAAAIITPTQSGSTARMVSRFRPKAPIIATTSEKDVMRKLCLSFGVYPVNVPFAEVTDDIIDRAVNAAVAAKLVNSGDLVVITAGIGAAGSTNLIKVHIVGEILAKGIGIGDKSITGKVTVVTDIERDFNKLVEGDILVARSTDKELVPLMEKASAFIVEEGGITSHAAIAGISLRKPVIVGVDNAVKLLRDGQLITMDTVRGLIYSGAARVL